MIVALILDKTWLSRTTMRSCTSPSSIVQEYFEEKVTDLQTKTSKQLSPKEIYLVAIATIRYQQ
ncbi:hypothetical protein J6590_059664 [Homalodisca vitripennis]|nr:hypothetical protein J6590_059664 [Homalodisca vitripennis]